jgi:hypothetical protein
MNYKLLLVYLSVSIHYANESEEERNLGKLNGRIWTRFLKIRFFLILLPILTSIVIIFHPEYLYKDKKYFKTNYENLDLFWNVCPICNDNWVGFGQSRTGFRFFLYNSENKTFQELELSGFSAIAHNGSIFCRYYHDKENQKLLMVLTKNISEYHLTEISYKNNKITVTSNLIFNDELYEEIQKDYITVNDINFKLQINENCDSLIIKKSMIIHIH